MITLYCCSGNSTCSLTDIRVVYSGVGASVLEPLPRLLWLSPPLQSMEKHGKDLQLSVVVLNRHRHGVARGDATLSLKASVLLNAQHEPLGALVADVPRHGHALRPSHSHVNRFGHDSVLLLVIGLRMVYFSERLVSRMMVTHCCFACMAQSQQTSCSKVLVR